MNITRARRPVLAGTALSMLFALSSCVSTLQWAPYGDVATVTLQEWLGDLDTLERETGRHPKLRAEPEVAAAFAASVDAVRLRLEAASGSGLPLDGIAVAGIAECLAAVGDGHTHLNAYPTEVFPVGVRWFPVESGWELRLVVVDQANAAWLGGRVVAVRTPEGVDVPVGDGGVPLEGTVHGLVSTVVSREDALDDELDALACRTSGPAVLQDPILARGIGLADDELVLVFDPATLPAGTAATLALQPRQGATWARVLDSAPATPLSRQSSEPWWYQLDGSGALYLQYNECDGGASGLLDEVAAAVEAGTAKSLIVDLRWNSGGNSTPGSRFASRIAAAELGQESGRLYVLVGPVTFSSAMMLAVDFKKSTRAIVAGMPLVEPTSHYGEVVRFALPASGIVVGRSSRLFQDYGGLGAELARGVIEPDAGWRIDATYDEYRAGRDPALEAVLAAAGE